MSEVKLLPCPFCSHEACMDGEPGSWGYYPATAFVRCGKCDARGPTFHDDEGGSRDYRAEAASAWNCRADALAQQPAADTHNRRLKAQLEQEWANLQDLKRAYQTQQTADVDGAKCEATHCCPSCGRCYGCAKPALDHLAAQQGGPQE